MTLWSSPHPKESTALSLGQAQQSSEVVKIKDLTDPGTIMPASATSFASDGSEDAGFEDGSIDVDMGEEEAEGIQIDCIQTLTEFEPAEGDLNGVDNGNTSMAGSKTPIPLPPPPMQLGSGTYGGNQAYASSSLPTLGIMDQPSSPGIDYWNHSTTPDTVSRPTNRAPGDVGLNNIGNTCFMNSGLQCLLHTSPLVEFFVLSDKFERTMTSLAYQFHSVMNHAWFGYAGAIALHDFKLVLGNKYAQFKDCRQHDCQEFLAVLLDMLHEELKSKQKAALTIADSSVGESYMDQCDELEKITDQGVDTTTAAPSSSSSALSCDMDTTDDGNVTESGEIDSKATRKTSSQKSPATHKRLKLEKDVNEEDREAEPTLSEQETDVEENDDESTKEVKRKSATVKTDKQQELRAYDLSQDNNIQNEDAYNENEAEGSGHIDDDKSQEERERMSPVEKADEYWDKYMKENRTVIASTFQGMFKSAVTCSECGFVSETYEPFMYLSLPIPRVMEKQISVTFISMKDRNSIKVDLTAQLTWTVQSLVFEVLKCLEDYARDTTAKFAAAEIVNYRITRVLDEKLQLRHLSTNTRNIYVYELNDNFDDRYGSGSEVLPGELCRKFYGPYPYQVKTNGVVTSTKVIEDWEVTGTTVQSTSASTSTSTYGAPVGGGMYDASATFAQASSATSDDPLQIQDNDNFNRVQCNICLEDYPKNDLKQHRGCSCVLCEECLQKSVEHFQGDKGEPQQGSYVKCAVCLRTVDYKQSFGSLDDSGSFSSPLEFITVPVIFRNEPGTDANNNASYTPGLFGYPWLIRVPSYLNAFELVEYIESINPVPEAPHRILSVKSDGKNCGQCVFSFRCNGCELPKEGMISLSPCNSILISFTDLASERLAVMQPPDMAIHNELSSAYNQSRNDEPTVDIHDCLRTFSETEHLDEQNPWYCPKCKKNQRATKALSICKFPDYLIVYLKRFVFLDQESNKLNNRLTFPVNDLDVSEYVTEGFANVGKYDLYSCVCHFGSASGGHYAAFAKNPLTNKWKYFNDDSITEREPADAEHSSAYVLFYERQGMSYNIPSQCSKPLPELNSLKTMPTASFSADTQGSCLPGDSPVPAGPVRIEGEVNHLMVDSTSPNFSYPVPANSDLFPASEVDEGVGNEMPQLAEVRDGLGLSENDSADVSSSTSATCGEVKEVELSDLGIGCSDSTTTTSATSTVTTVASPLFSTQHPEPSSSSMGGADSTSN